MFEKIVVTYILQDIKYKRLERQNKVYILINLNGYYVILNNENSILCKSHFK